MDHIHQVRSSDICPNERNLTAQRLSFLQLPVSFAHDLEKTSGPQFHGGTATDQNLVSFRVLFGGVGPIPPATALNYIPWTMVGFIFQYLIRRRRFIFWAKYNCTSAFCGII